MKKFNLLTDKCRNNTCSHKKCRCGHCSAYHVFTGECSKIHENLSTCECNKFKEEDKLK